MARTKSPEDYPKGYCLKRVVVNRLEVNNIQTVGVSLVILSAVVHSMNTVHWTGWTCELEPTEPRRTNLCELRCTNSSRELHSHKLADQFVHVRKFENFRQTAKTKKNQKFIPDLHTIKKLLQCSLALLKFDRFKKVLLKKNLNFNGYLEISRDLSDCQQSIDIALSPKKLKAI